VHGPPRRLPAELESTVYFVVSEAIANTGKYAQASTIRIVLTMTEQDVVAEISDDGIGGAVPGSGTGLVGLRDRVAAFGGTLSVTSSPGAGTQVRMMIPCG
jgi:signal transduction histidine kinase